MIRLRDATMLALTKLRTRKIRLIVTIIISGLLFSGLAAASLVARGVMNGVKDFGREGLGDRYIAQVYPQSSFYGMEDPGLVDRATALHKDLIARKKAEAKRLGISYNAETEPSPVTEFDYPGVGKQRSLNPQHPLAIQAYQEFYADKAKQSPGQKELEASAKPYGAIAYYSSMQVPYDLAGGQLQVLKDGKETLDPTVDFATGPPSGIDTFATSWSAMSKGLLQPFILPGQSLATGADGNIPIIVPSSAAEQILKLKALPASASPNERLARTKEIRQKAPDIRFTVCYRNSTSVELVSQAVATQKELEANKNKKDYQRPDLIYGVPAEPCGSVSVTRDVRSKEQKTLDEKQRQFDETFGKLPAEQSTLTFRIVGIVPDPDYGSAFGVGQIIKSLVTSSLGNGWYMPTDQIAEQPLLTKLFANQQQNIFPSLPTYYVEFDSAASAREYIEKENCPVDFSKLKPGDDPAALCAETGKFFSLAPYGSNSLALESAKRGFGKFFGIAALIVAGIAAIIMMGTVGRMIADSRRETAVFRAIGAKKLDISQIYILYTICLSLMISAFAVVAGLLLASIAHNRWSEEVTLQAIIAYNARDLDKVFSLYAFYLPDMLMLGGLALAAGVLSALLPLFRNLRRNPIRDMRDDT